MVAVSWAECDAMVRQIQLGDRSGMAELYRVFQRSVRPFLASRLREEDVEDGLHDAFLAVVEAIRKGMLSDPTRLMGFMWTLVRRWVVHQYRYRTARKRQSEESHRRNFAVSCDPEQLVLRRERTRAMRARLAGLPTDDRGILVRFYLQDQPWEQICAEMRLTQKQFELRKWRAKAKLAGRMRG